MGNCFNIQEKIPQHILPLQELDNSQSTLLISDEVIFKNPPDELLRHHNLSCQPDVLPRSAFQFDGCLVDRFPPEKQVSPIKVTHQFVKINAWSENYTNIKKHIIPFTSLCCITVCFSFSQNQSYLQVRYSSHGHH